MSDEKPDKFRIGVPDLSKHAGERTSPAKASRSVFVEAAIGVVFFSVTVILFLILIPFLLIGFAIGAIINRLRGNSAARGYLSEEELEKLLEDANQGDTGAQYGLGHHYEARGVGTPNYEEAVKWYRMAASEGHPFAQFCLRSLYESGFGGTPDYEEEIEWYQNSASEGDAHAQFNLGKMFANGHGVEQDDVQAWMWCMLAQEFNYMSMGTDHELEERIDEMLDELKGRMSDSEIEKAKELVENSFKATS